MSEKHRSSDEQTAQAMGEEREVAWPAELSNNLPVPRESSRGTEHMCDLMGKLIAEARRIEEDAEHSFKGHHNAASRWALCHLWLGLPSALMAAAASGVAFQDHSVLAGALALFSTALITVLTFLKPSERSEIHKTVAGQYQLLRNQARMFREIELLDCAVPDEAKKRLYALARQRDELNERSPGIARGDYELAKQDIDSGRAVYRFDEEKP